MEKGFEARRLIDLQFIRILKIPFKEPTDLEFLSILYAKLLREICLIKRSATEV